MGKNKAISGSFTEIITSRAFTLPRYQRSYAWNEKHIEDFTDDLEYLINSEDQEHYMDSLIIYTEDKDSIYKIVDGQQRVTTLMLLFACFRDEILKYKHEEVEDDALKSDIDGIVERCGKALTSLDGINNWRYMPDEEQRKVYKKLVDNNMEDPDVENLDNPSDINLVQNKNTISDWVRKKFEDLKPEDSESRHQEIFVSEVRDAIDKIRRNLIFTIYEVEDALEANRMFEIVNDRGKNVNVADKVKSYLNYYLSIKEDNERTKEVYKVFNDLQTVVGGDNPSKSDTRINRFMTEHWRLFSGQVNDVDVSDAVKANLRRGMDHESGKKFVDAYLSSIERNMPYFKYIMDDVDVILREGDEECVTDNRSNLYVISNFGPEQAVLPYCMSIMSSYDNLTKKDPAHKALSEVENLVVLHHNILGKRNDFARSIIRKHAADIEWCASEYDSEDMFVSNHNESNRTISSNIDEAVKNSRESLKKKIQQNNIYQVLDNKNNWLEGDAGSTGIDKDIMKYILYRYEYDKYLKQLPNSDKKVNEFENNKSDTFTLEHILPYELDEDYKLQDYDIQNEDEHGILKNNIGNLAILSIIENIKASNKPYSEKKSSIYSNDKVTGMIKQGVVDQYDEWGASAIESRAKKINRYILDTWT